ncbi:hypothetical protein C2S51_011925 [Perilla frutescens var. frutescens]|nr:hypothetical protein C2S51_011925 [Perilla frutescens var. frutescens]
MAEISETENTANTTNTPDDITIQLANLLKHSLNLQPIQNNNTTESLSIGFKLNGDNYPLWAILMRKAIGGRGKSSYLTKEPPATTESTYKTWEQEDQCVFTWLIQNVETHIINSVSKYPTAKAVWDGLAITYGSGTDSLQVFDLHRKANTLKQEEYTIEETWAKFQEIWMTIDRREPNPMICSKDIDTFNQIVQHQRLFQFLTALNGSYEPVKKELLKRDPLPSVDFAYAMVRRETARDRILRPVVNDDGGASSGIGAGLAARDRDRNRKGNWPRKPEDDKSKLICSHCGMKKHTRETCFQLVGYPDWWDETKKTKLPGKNRGGIAAAATTANRATSAGAGNIGGGQSEAVAMEVRVPSGEGKNGNSRSQIKEGRNFKNCSLVPIKTSNQFQALEELSSACTVPLNNTDKNAQWIFDCGATDTMTFDKLDIVQPTHSRRTHVQTANGELAPVMGAGTINLIFRRGRLLGVALSAMDYTMWMRLFKKVL